MLPAQANLEHLRNESKERLRELRRQNPTAKLADAQLAVARSYGFASWRKLKSHVDALDSARDRILNAVRAGDLDGIRTVLDGYPELVNAATGTDQRVLRPSDTLAMRLIHLAVAENQVEAARVLMERGADLNVRNADGRLPVHDCFELGLDEFAQVLFAVGAEADVCAAAAYGMHARLRQILTQDASQANDLRTGMLPFGWSVYGNQLESARILVEYRAILDRPPYDVEAWGPVTHVANVEFAKFLLSHGASPNCENKNGDTPMHAAIKSRLVRDPTAFIELLLASGADRTLRNHAGRTALEEAILQVGKDAETYFPARPTGAKKLERAIAMLTP